MTAFSRLVRECMREAPPAVHPAMPCGEALRIMREFPASSVVITTPEGRPTGILTEQDVVRRLTFTHPAETRVSEVMTGTLKVIHDEDYLFQGIALRI